MMRAVRYYETGGPDVLHYEDVPDAIVGEGEVLIKAAAVGVNFSEIGRRKGIFPLPPGVSLPNIPGYECAGIVEEVGPGVEGFAKGDRVLAWDLPHTYMEYVTAPAERVFKVPDNISLTDAAVVSAPFTTGWEVVIARGNIQPGETVLVQAAASGVGIGAVQLAKHIGATVIGTASTDAKLEWAKGYGLDHGVNYATKNFVDEVKRLTGGEGVDAVVDGVGGEVFNKSLECLKMGGRLLTYGVASGVRTAEITVPRLWFGNQSIIGVYANMITRDEFNQILYMLSRGDLRATLDRTWPLQEAAEAHRYIGDRKVKGKVALTLE
jgi:NADPH2:quinone reductase